MKSEKEMLHEVKYLGWKYVCQFYNLSEEFIEKYIDNVNWYYISRYQDLSEEFIEKHIKNLWVFFAQYQKLSLNFLLKHRRIIYWDLVKENKNISREIFEEAVPNNDMFLECCLCNSKLVNYKILDNTIKYCPRCLR